MTNRHGKSGHNNTTINHVRNTVDTLINPPIAQPMKAEDFVEQEDDNEAPRTVPEIDKPVDAHGKLCHILEACASNSC